MRVALLHPFIWPEVRRGAERYVDDLAWYLSGQGHDVEVIAGSYERSGVDERDGVVVRRLRHRLGRRFRSRGVTAVETFGAVALPTLMRRRYDVVHAFVPSAALAARAARQPTLFSLIGHPTTAQLHADPVNGRLLGYAVRRATTVAALSRASASQTALLFGRDAEVLPPGVRLTQFDPALEARSGPPRILFSGFVGDRRKGLDVALAAFAHVLEQRPDARLLLSGGGDPAWASDLRRPDVAAAVDQLGPGSPDEVPRRYRSATVTVLPAQDEAFGLALVESLASGTPVVCADAGGMPEIVDAGAVGRVAAAAGPDALATALLETIALAADPVTPQRCVDHARRWGWSEAVGPMHEALYHRMGRHRDEQ
jgi:glycosyltransferase involved in cell wall biosynthesis